MEWSKSGAQPHRVRTRPDDVYGNEGWQGSPHWVAYPQPHGILRHEQPYAASSNLADPWKRDFKIQAAKQPKRKRKTQTLVQADQSVDGAKTTGKPGGWRKRCQQCGATRTFKAHRVSNWCMTCKKSHDSWPAAEDRHPMKVTNTTATLTATLTATPTATPTGTTGVDWTFPAKLPAPTAFFAYSPTHLGQQDASPLRIPATLPTIPLTAHNQHVNDISCAGSIPNIPAAAATTYVPAACVKEVCPASTLFDRPSHPYTQNGTSQAAISTGPIKASATTPTDSTELLARSSDAAPRPLMLSIDRMEQAKLASVPTDEALLPKQEDAVLRSV